MVRVLPPPTEVKKRQVVELDDSKAQQVRHGHRNIAMTTSVHCTCTHVVDIKAQQVRSTCIYAYFHLVLPMILPFCTIPLVPSA